MLNTDEIPFGSSSPIKTETKLERKETRSTLSTTVSELDLIPEQAAPEIFEFQEETKNFDVENEKEKQKLNFKYNPSYEHELITD